MKIIQAEHDQRISPFLPLSLPLEKTPQPSMWKNIKEKMSYVSSGKSLLYM